MLCRAPTRRPEMPLISVANNYQLIAMIEDRNQDLRIKAVII